MMQRTPPTGPSAVGRSILRAEDADFLTGRARYVADLNDPRLADPAYAVFVRSPHAHARVTGIDTSAAAAAPGVVAVYTSADLAAAGVTPAGPLNAAIPPRFTQPLLADGKVRFAGEPVAVVLADTVAAAVDAAELVDVDYEPLVALLDLDHALANRVLLFDGDDSDDGDDGDVTGNVATDTGWVGSDRTGPGPSPFDEAEVLVQHRAMNPRQSPAPIEPRAVACAWPEDGRLMVWAAIQRPHGFRDELCELYRLPTEAVTVIAGPEVGGGFGGKVGRTPEERIMPFLARATGRPVRWAETRSEYLLAATQGRGERIDYTLAGTRDGRIRAIRAELVKDAGAYPMTGALLPAGYTVPSATGPYAIDHAEIRAVAVATNRVATSAFRGAGRAPYLAGLETLVDRYAAEIGLDPADVRRRNLVTPDQMPHRTPTGAVYDEADYPADLERALTAAGYADLRAEQAQRRASSSGGDPRQLGIGIACYNHVTVGGTKGGGEEASVTILPGGPARARVATGTTSQGHGHRTTWAQLASDVLGIPVAQIEVVEGTTEATATGVGAVGSRSLQTAGIAIHRAATDVVEQAKTAAAELLEAAAADIVLDAGTGSFHVVGTPARAVTWGALAVEVASGPGGRELTCGEVFDNDGLNTYPSGTHVAVVEVDTETGFVELVRFVAADDAGTRVNPMIVDGQLHGGIASGISQALGEVVHYDPAGNLITSTFMDYQLATTDMLPSFELVPAEVASSFNELGVKGVGESGTIGATPAVHNAVLDAIGPFGVTHLDLPCTPLRVWEALNRGSAQSGRSH